MNKLKQFWLLLVVITTVAVYIAGRNYLMQNTASSLHFQAVEFQKTRNNSTILSETQSENGVNESHKGTYVLSMTYSGQQGAGVRGVLSLQCFASNLGIPVYVVEPFISSSKVGLGRLPDDLNGKLKLSDFFDLDHFNLASAMAKYVNLSTWEEFLKNAPNKMVIVELKSGRLKRTEVLWTATDSQCYQGWLLKDLHLRNVTPCVVRVVKICCVRDDRKKKFSPKEIISMEAVYDTVFGKWKPEEVSLLFTGWVSVWFVPGSKVNSLDCKGAYNHYIHERFYPSQQLLKHAKHYTDLFLQNKNITAVMLRFEHMLRKMTIDHSPVTVDSCLKELETTVKQLNATFFVAADIGKYGSKTWDYTFKRSHFSSERGSQSLKAFKQTLSGLVTDIEMWEKGFAQATGGIEDKGYIAALQRTLGSRANCIVLLGGGNFQNIVLQEYIDNHPNPSEQCVYSICVREKHAKVYQKYIQHDEP